MSSTERPLRAWVIANGVGELLGLGLGALIGIPAQIVLGQRLPPLVAAAISAGLFAVIEGPIVGIAQWRVLASLAPAIGAARWVAATLAGGLLAWLCVSVPLAFIPETTSAGGTGPSLPVQLVAMAAVGFLAGPILGMFQALALRRVSATPWRWILANALAWAAGLPIIQLGAGSLPPGTAVWVLVLVAIVSLFIAGCVVGRIHGPRLFRIIDVSREADRR